MFALSLYSFIFSTTKKQISKFPIISMHYYYYDKDLGEMWTLLLSVGTSGGPCSTPVSLVIASPEAGLQDIRLSWAHRYTLFCLARAPPAWQGQGLCTSFPRDHRDLDPALQRPLPSADVSMVQRGFLRGPTTNREVIGRTHSSNYWLCLLHTGKWIKPGRNVKSTDLLALWEFSFLHRQ